WWARHNSLVHILSRAVSDNGGLALIEPRNTSIHDHSRPDIELIMGSHHTFIDVVCTHPTTTSMIIRTTPSSAPFISMDRSIHDKHVHYASVSARIGADFIAAAFDTYGAFSTPSIDLCKMITEH